MYTVTAHIACITSRVGREKNNLETPIGHVYLTSIYNKQKYTLKSLCFVVNLVCYIVCTHISRDFTFYIFEVLKLLLGKLRPTKSAALPA